MRRFTHDEVVADFDAQFAQTGDFVNEADGVNDHTVADDAQLVFAQDAGRHEVQDVFCLPMKTVWPALLPPA